MSVVPLVITAHVEGQGDVTVSGPQQFVGTKGQSRRVEGFSVNPPPGVEVEYMAHIEGQGDTHWHRNGQFVGTKGMSRRMEGFAVRLVGYSANQYDVKYYAHIAGSGDSPIAANGGFVGSRGQSRRVEGLAIWLEARGGVAYTPAGSFAPAYTAAPVYPQPVYPSPVPVYSPPMPTFTPAVVFTQSPPQLQVTALVQGNGTYTAYGQQYAGTKGQGRIMEAFSINHSIPGLEIEYMAHIENRGDTHWHRNGQQVGHYGGGRIEGFAVRLQGPASGQFDVKYYGHIEGSGDSPIACNGGFIGTRGQSRRLEGLAVWLEPRRY